MIGRRALLLIGLALATPAAAKTDWTTTVVATPEGGIRIGNPAAKVKIIEFASYTCPHCKAFNEVGVPALKAKYIATGNVSLEMRSFMRNGPDFAASLLVTCLPAPQALGLADALFAEQANWVKPFTTLTEADGTAIGALPLAQQPARMAAVTGLDKWAAARGLPLARAQACLADTKAQDRLIAIYKDALETWKLEGTPTFVINKATASGVFDWASLEPKVITALK